LKGTRLLKRKERSMVQEKAKQTKTEGIKERGFGHHYLSRKKNVRKLSGEKTNHPRDLIAFLDRSREHKDRRKKKKISLSRRKEGANPDNRQSSRYGEEPREMPH